MKESASQACKVSIASDSAIGTHALGCLNIWFIRPLYIRLCAPRVGIEPTTNSLHLSSDFSKGWTISSPVLGARRFPGASLCRERQVLPFGIVSEPSRHHFYF